MKRFLVMLAMSALLVGCGGNGRKNSNETSDAQSVKVDKATPMAFDDLAGEWAVVGIGKNTYEVEKEYIMFFNIASMEMSAYVGCNSIGAKINREGRSADYLRFVETLATQMACEDMEAEQELLSLLENIRSFVPVAETLTLRDENDKTLITLKRI